MTARYKVLMAFMGIMVVVWVVYLFFVQVLDAHNIKNYGINRYIPKKEVFVPKRGSIYDSKGNLLVSTIRSYQVEVDRGSIRKYCTKNKISIDTAYHNLAKLISRRTGLARTDILKLLNRTTKANSVVISRKITESQLLSILAAVKHEKIPGIIYSLSGMKRTYAQGMLASRVLGLATQVNKPVPGLPVTEPVYGLRGLTGLESTFNDYLQGEYGWREYMKNARNQKIPDPRLAEKKAVDGYSLHLTIDMKYQELMENNLREGMTKYNAKNSLGLIMKPDTGEILAIAGLSKNDEYQPFSLVRSMPALPVTFIFEPGSTMKPIPALVALEEGLFKPEDIIDCSSYFKRGRRITDSHPKGQLSFKQVITYSSNVGISLVADKIGERRLFDRLVALGFGSKICPQLYGESPGIFRDISKWYPGYSLQSIAFGQEIGVTAIQLANAYCTLANGGKVMEPHVVSKITDSDGNVIEDYPPKVVRTLSDPRSLAILRDFLKSVVEEGTATSCRLSYITIGGKTGTAEKMKEGGGGYAQEKYTSVFCGFFPTEEPELVMLVAFDEPDYVYHFASVSAAPIFKKITEEILLLPSCPILPQVKQKYKVFYDMPDVQGRTLSEARTILREKGIKFNPQVIDSTGVVINQFPKGGVSFEYSNIAIIVVDKKEKAEVKSQPSGTMPNLIGLSVRRAIETAKQYNLFLNVKGRGMVAEQSIPVGTAVEFGNICKVVAR